MLLTISFDFNYYPLLVIGALAWLIPMVMSLVRANRIPTVIIEILAGYFIGRYFLEGYEKESMQIVEFLALTGFMFLMFLSGLEIDVDQIINSFPRKKINYAGFLRNPFLVGLFIFGVSLLLSGLGAILLSGIVEIRNVWYFALIMITTSVGIILPVLKNRGEINTRYGQMLILAAAIADILSILLFTITAFVIKEGLHADILYLLSLAVIFVLFYGGGRFLNRIPLFRRLIYQLSHAASQIQVRGAMLIALIFVVLSQYIGKEVMLLGAFLGGLLLSMFLQKARSLLLIKLDGMGYGFFIPIFFIMVGIQFDPSALLELDDSLYLFLLLFLITLFTVKVIPSLIWSRLFGFRKAMAGGFLISSRLSLIIAASAIGLELGLITPGINASIVLMAVITCLFSPLVFNQIYPKVKFAGEKTIIVGGSSTAVLLARRLKMHNREAVIVESCKDRYEDIKSKGIDVVYEDGCNADTYSRLKLSHHNYVVVLTEDDQRNIEICKVLRNDLNHEKVITKANKAGIERILKNLEVESFDSTRVVATSIENMIIRPTTYHTLVESFENFYVEEIKVTGSEIEGKQIKDLPFHKDGTLMLIRRQNNMYIPHGDTYLKQGDILNVFGTPTALKEIRLLVS
ncbi:MAG: cation:proton antiporter [Bacteroidales bacterium]|nr:cation:proton antiporter [Bacteroidales bacterium]MCF8386341.1 cation:proton antiporter [Bacteroidales bacterium]MCF8396817.1 cation:proton antiporter [Bacteroidales bacterium]